MRSVPVSTRALFQRLNRLLQAENKILKKARGIFAERDLGTYFVVRGDDVVSHHVDIERFGREVGALAAYERLVED